MSKNRKIVFSVIASVLLLIFGVWNILWFMYSQKYSKLQGNLEKSTVGGITRYSTKSDGYYCSMQPPSYLNFNGNICVNNKTVERNTEKEVSLFVWINLFSNTEYGVMIEDDDQHVYQIYTDKTGTPLFSENEDAEYIKRVNDLLNSYQNNTSSVFSAFNRVFGIHIDK